MLKITTEKIVERGEPKRRITAITGLMKNKDLPRAYIKGVPRIEENGNLFLRDDRSLWFVRSLLPGTKYDEEFWSRTILPQIKEAGEKLHSLRQEEKKLKETWKGEETFVI